MSEKIDRRKLLAGAGLGGALLLLQTGGCSSNGSGAAAKGKPKYVMVFDQNKCVGCGDCKDACTKVNELPKGQSRLALQFTCGTDGTAQCPKEDAPRGYAYDRRYVRVSCQQCQDAPCVKVCPTGAAHRDPETGIVTMNPDKCIGCKYDALIFGDASDEKSYVSRLLKVKDSVRIKPELGTDPVLRYIPIVKLGV